uniref:Transmembrane protein n=1 Tax=Panagrolaimus sp. PS1159 TaxID=55785 RepID=A0AC35G7Y1_9BILA
MPNIYNTFILVIILLLSLLFTHVYCLIKAEAFHDSKHNVTRINLDKKSSIELFKKWQDQALSGLMASVASKKIGTVSKEHATAHEKCAKFANSVIKHAKCVSKLLQLPSIKNQPKSKSEKEKKALFARLKPEQIHQPINPLNPSSKLLKLEKSKRIMKYGKKRKQRKNRNKSKNYPKSNRKSSNFKFQNSRKLQNHFISTYPFQPQPRRYMGAKAINFNPNQNHRRFNSNYFYRQQLFQKNRKYKKVGEIEVLAKRRRKRYSIKSDSQYSLHNSELNLTPIGKVAQNLIKTVLDIKNKTERV